MLWTSVHKSRAHRRKLGVDSEPFANERVWEALSNHSVRVQSGRTLDTSRKNVPQPERYSAKCRGQVRNEQGGPFISGHYADVVAAFDLAIGPVLARKIMRITFRAQGQACKSKVRSVSITVPVGFC